MSNVFSFNPHVKADKPKRRVNKTYQESLTLIITLLKLKMLCKFPDCWLPVTHNVDKNGQSVVHKKDGRGGGDVIHKPINKSKLCWYHEKQEGMERWQNLQENPKK
jgi:hypothetical protein